MRAFIKRLLQVAEAQPSQLLCGLLFLLSEVLKARPELGSLKHFLKEEAGGVQKFKDEDDDDEEEHYEDVKEEDADQEVKKEGALVAPGWTFKGAAGSSSAHTERNCYDPTARNPLYCGAGHTALWELERLSNHFHPSAALFASNLLAGQSISYSGDPLGDFTLARFLDRFVFRNPKQNPEKNKPLTVLGKRNIYRPSGIKAVAPDSVDFRNRDLENVPKDEVFLYKYFNEKVERKGEKVEDDKVSVTSEEFNDYLDKMSGGRQADFDDEDIDFAGGLEEENARKRKAGDDDEDEDAEAGDDEDMEDGVEDDEEDEPVLEGEDDDGFKELESDGEEDADGDFDEEGFGGADSDDFDEEMSKPSPIPKKGKQKKAKFPKFDPNNLDSILADAEQFSHLIEENDDDAGLTSSVSNSDKAGKKQLAWERKREGAGGGYKGKKGAKGGQKKGSQSKGGNAKPMPFKSKPLAKKRKKS